MHCILLYYSVQGEWEIQFMQTYNAKQSLFSGL